MEKYTSRAYPRGVDSPGGLRTSGECKAGCNGPGIPLTLYQLCDNMRAKGRVWYLPAVGWAHSGLNLGLFQFVASRYG